MQQYVCDRRAVTRLKGQFILTRTAIYVAPPGTSMATLFCPSCSNLLVISADTGANKWACNTCPYEFPITKQMTSRTHLRRKRVDDVLGGEEMWKHADSIAGKGSNLPFAYDGPPPLVWIYPAIPTLLTIHPCVCSIYTATCEKCEHGRAYFYQLQIRSADEPMTTCECVSDSFRSSRWNLYRFFRFQSTGMCHPITRGLPHFPTYPNNFIASCAGCAHQWREN